MQDYRARLDSKIGWFANSLKNVVELVFLADTSKTTFIKNNAFSGSEMPSFSNSHQKKMVCVLLPLRCSRQFMNSKFLEGRPEGRPESPPAGLFESPSKFVRKIY